MSGSSTARSSTSARSRDGGQHPGGGGRLGVEREPLAQAVGPREPRCRVPRDPGQVGDGLGEVDDQHPLGADGPGEAGKVPS